MRQFILSSGYNANLEAASAGQVSFTLPSSKDALFDLVLKRLDANGGNVLYPVYGKEFMWSKASYAAATQFKAVFTVPDPVPYADYTVTFVKKGVQFNERCNWSATVRSNSTDTASTIAAKIVKYVKDNFTTLKLSASNAEAIITITGPASGEDYEVKFSDELYGTILTSITHGKKAFMDANMIVDLQQKAAADAGFEYTYDELDIYPGNKFNPLASPDKVDTGFIVYTLRFVEPRLVGTRDEKVYQIIQIAFPTGTTVTEFETKLNTIKAL